MAYNINFQPLDELTKNLEAVSRGNMAKYVLYPGAGDVADKIRASLNHAIKNPTGALARSLNIATMRGSAFKADTVVSFVGYSKRRGKDVPNALIAAVLESGRSDQPGRTATHFFSNAVRAARKSAPKEMEKAADRYIDNIFNK